jgi:hypothetical protein
MKKKNVIFLGVLFFMFIGFLISCKPKEDIERDKKLTTNVQPRVISTKYAYYEIIEADGHKYLFSTRGGGVHMESCPCKSKN